jgi:hypothetical protein
LATGVREAVSATAPLLEVAEIKPMEEMIPETVSRLRLNAILISAFAARALAGSKWRRSSFQPQLLGAPAQHLGREDRTVLAHRDFVGIEVRAPTRLSARQDANDFAIGADLQNTAGDCVGHEMK